MLLAVDIGNTNITLGIFTGESLRQRLCFVSNPLWTPDEYGIAMLDSFRRVGVAAANINAIALGSVVPALTPLLAEACINYLGCMPFIADETMQTGLRSLYDNPRQLGVDRIIAAAAAYKMYGGPACVIDFGTATTFDAVSADGCHLGGAIAPGMGITAEALFRRVSKLYDPDIAFEYERSPSVIGRSVRQSLQSGLLYGYVGLVEGMIARFRAELGADAKIIATGGLSGIIAGETAVIDILAPYLLLDGLNILYHKNCGSEITVTCSLSC